MKIELDLTLEECAVLRDCLFAALRSSVGEETEKRQAVTAAVLEAIAKADDDDDEPKWVDPVDCGCTDCCVGYSRPARDYEEYKAAQRKGRAR